MTRKTFHHVIAGIALSAGVLASPLASAYFAVSVPGSAITMSGVQHAPQPAPATPVAPAVPQERKAAIAETRQVKRSFLRALFLPSL